MPNREDVRRAIQAIKRATDFEYFFEHLQSPGWIGPLKDEGLFSSPPEPVRDGKYVSFPFWAPSQYLVRMSESAPTEVMDVIELVPKTENVRVHEDFVAAAAAMPAQVAVRIVPLALDWIASPYQLLLPDKLGRLLAHLATGGEVDGALQLARGLLAFRPVSESDSSGRSFFFDRHAAVIESYQYEEILSRDVPALRQAAPRATFELLAEVLEEAAKRSVPSGAEVDREDFSSSWQPSIEPSEQDRDYDVRPALVRAVTRSAEELVRDGEVPLAELVAALDARPAKIFSRIGLHLVRLFHDRDDALAKAILFDARRADDATLFHEYWLLAQTLLPLLEGEEKAAFLQRLTDETDQEIAEASKLEAEQERQYETNAARYGLKRKLTLLKGNLPEAWAARLEELERDLPPVDHPEFLSFSTTTWVGPTSPKAESDLATMSAEQVLEYLRSWQPSGRTMDHSREGLARALTSRVSNAAEEYASAAEGLRTVDPTYVHAYFWGLREALKAHREFDWVPVLGLARWVIEQPRHIPGRVVEDEDDSDPDWGESRRAIAGLLEDGLAAESAGIPFDLRQVVWAILEPLTRDPDPTPEHERQYGGSNVDPMTLSINNVRSIALHAVVCYGLWMRRQQEKSQDKPAIERGFDEMPEVRNVLERHLDPHVEPAQACRAVYGRWFPWLLLLGPAWAREHASDIFPVAAAQRPLRNAAWGAYLLYSGIFESVFDALRVQYAFGVERLGQENYGGHHGTEPDRRLVDHLMIFYWRGKLPLDDTNGLIQRFYAVASPELRAHALAFIGRTLESLAEQPPEDVRQRMEALFDWRLEVATAEVDRATELAEYGAWFGSGRFESAWALPRLMTVLRTGRKLEARHHVAKVLRDLSASDVKGAMSALRWLIETEETGWGMSLWVDDARAILQRALASADDETRGEAVDSINLLAARGDRSFVELLAASNAS